MTKRRMYTRLFAKLVTGGGPYTSLASAQAMVKDLRTQSSRAPRIIGKITGMEQRARDLRHVPVLVVDRPSWVVGATDSIEAMFDGREGADRIGSVAVGGLFSFLAGSILGQYDPYSGTHGKLYLVAPNIAHFRETYNLDRRDLALWVSVHEMTHALQAIAAPWLAGALASRASILATTEDDDERSAVMDETTAIMSLLEGHATYVMDQVPIVIMPSRERLGKALAKRRTSGSKFIKMIRKFAGVQKKMAQYSSGTSFTKHVVEAVDMDAFNKVWESEDNLPTLHEIRHPDEWIERVVA